MHIADGVITDPAVLAGTWILGGGGILVASRAFARDQGEERAALVGVLGAFVFAAQMVNFPLLGLPVSTHLVGTGLITCLLGPAAAIVVIAAVLLVQALLLQDGGVIAYGANALNLAVAGALAAAIVIRAVPARIRGHGAVGAAAAVAAVFASTAACSLELILGADLDPRLVIAGLGTSQALSAVWEGAITVLSLAAIRAILGRGTPVWPSAGSPA